MTTKFNSEWYPLTSNIDDVEGKSRDREIGIAVKKADLFKGVKSPVFYAYRYGMAYDPTDDFAPNKSGQRIKGDHVEAYYLQLPAAREEYARLLEMTGGKKDENKKEDLKEMNELTNKLKEQAAIIEALRREMASHKKPERARHELFEKIAYLVNKKRAVYLYGPAGTGKSDMAEQIAIEIGLNFYPQSTLTQEFKFTGFQDGNGLYHDTNFFKAFTDGGLYFLDEMDSSSSDVLVGLNGALANGYFDFPTGTKKAHKDFRVIAAGNTTGRGATDDYTARQQLDLSTLDRFLTIYIDYSPTIERAITNDDAELLDFTYELRNAAKNSMIPVLISYRGLSNIMELKEDNMFTLPEIIDMTIIKGMPADDMKQIARNMDVPSTNKYFKAFKQATARAAV